MLATKGDASAEAELLRDPRRVAALLVRALLSTGAPEGERDGGAAGAQNRHGEDEDEEDEEDEEDGDDQGDDTMEDPDGSAASNVVASSATGGDDDGEEEEEEEEDNTEQVEEELEQQEEQALDEDTRPLDEEELETAASALLAATRAVDELRLKAALKTGRQVDQQQQAGKESVRARVGSGDTYRPGVPRLNARAGDNDHCKRCGRSFNPFHRSKSCTTCGFSFCPKCVSNQQVLPTCFGHKSDPMRVCDLCSAWFQKALDQYFDAMDLVKAPSTPPQPPPSPGASQLQPSPLSPPSPQQQSPPQERSQRSGSGESEAVAHRAAGVHSFAGPPSSASSVPEPTTARSERGYANEDSYSDRSVRRNHRRSQSISLSTKSPGTKPWFSGHLRAMHVGDRLPRKHKASGDGSELDADTLGSNRSTRGAAARTQSLGGPIFSSPIVQSTGEDAHGRHAKSASPGIGELSKSPPPVMIPIPDMLSLPETMESCAKAGELNTRPLKRTSSRRSRFGRSASFDLTTLHPPSQSPTGSMLNSPSSAKGVSGRASELSVDCSPLDMATASSDPKSFLLKKCFDDSDIVDGRLADISTSEGLRSDPDLPATVLRFAVYEMGAKENAGVRRALGFAKANPVLDRYTLELDCRQGIVRVKSVFMHRFWWFHCDTVQSFSVGSSTGMARLVIFNGGHGNQTLELKFANNEEREQFREAMNSYRSASIQSMKTYKGRADGLRDGHDLSSSDSPPLRGSFPGEPDENAASTSDGGSPEYAVQDPSCSVSSPRHMPTNFPYLPGEVLVKETELPATLLIGPAGESLSYETSMVWGRLRGMIAVTNYRVLFTPFDRIPLLSRPTEQFSVAYVPLFSITHVQLVYPGGRRTKSGRTYYAGMTGAASIIAITCKDVRGLRFQLDGPQMLSDGRTQKLYATISRMSDASQRYSKVNGGVDADASGGASSDLTPLTGSGYSSGGSADAPESSEDQLSGRNHRISYAKSPFGPVSSASPVLRPAFDASVLRERSGCFAFSYSIGWVPPDQNGWNLFVDEREFKRQIGGDTAVSPFLKYYQNAKGNICKTYPSKLLLPVSMTSATLVKVANFRAKNRLPVITYYHRRNRCVLTRSSQPLLGSLLSGSSNVSDQLLVNFYRRLPDIVKNQSQASQSSRPIYIFDARKPKASTGNRLMGKGGVETSQDYPGAVVHHLNIANMYRMQSSFMNLMKLLLPGGVEDDKAWWPSVESTRWLEHVRVVLEGAMKIARVLELEGSSALVHCSDGWDRTAQLTALAQLMIDPFFRTIRGFAVLVEKDWCAFGHKFSERLGGDRNRDAQRGKSSPIFFQFLDAVRQIQRQFPSAFEFNERFLLHLANSLTSGLYGTFLYDSRLQRDVNDVDRACVSVWTPVLRRPAPFRNPEFTEVPGPIWPWVSTKMIRLWENYFFQWHPKFYNCQWVSTIVAGHASDQSPWRHPNGAAVEDKAMPAGELSSARGDAPSSPTALVAAIPPLSLSTPT